MADTDDFPTAIVPTRPVGTRARFRELVKVYGDPMETLFRLQHAKNKTVDFDPVTGERHEREEDDRETQRQVAKELMPYGYVKRAAPISIAGDEEGGAGGGFALHIHFAGARPAPAIDVTPAPPRLPQHEEAAQAVRPHAAADPAPADPSLEDLLA